MKKSRDDQKAMEKKVVKTYCLMQKLNLGEETDRGVLGWLMGRTDEEPQRIVDLAKDPPPSTSKKAKKMLGIPLLPSNTCS